MTEAAFKRAADSQIRLLSALALFTDVEAKTKEERIAKSIADPFFFFRTYLPHYFADVAAPFHTELQQAIATYDEMQAITAFRGGAKSTIVFAEIIREVCLHNKLDTFFRFLVYQLDSLDKAEMYTQRILIELLYNERIKADFGTRVSRDAARGNFVCFDPETHRTLCRIVAFGAGMSMRGLVTEDTRPDWIISEDLQDRESAESDRRTKKLLRILLNDNRPALVPKRWRFTVIGNVICSGSVMDVLLDPLKHKGFRKLRYAACVVTPEGKLVSAWPSRFPMDVLDKLKEDIGDIAWLAEMMCQPVEQGGYYDEKRDIHHWMTLPRDLVSEGNTIVQVDPSFSEQGDCVAIGAVTPYTHTKDASDWNKWCDAKGKVFGEGKYSIVRRLFNRQCTIDTMILTVYEFFREFNPVSIYIDGSVEQEIVFERFFAEYEKKYGRLPIIWQDFHESKDLRIRSLQPYMQRRRVPLPPNTNEDVNATVVQFLRYGKPKVPDDGPDMLAAAVENTNEGVQQPANVEML